MWCVNLCVSLLFIALGHTETNATHTQVHPNMYAKQHEMTHGDVMW